MRLKFAKSTEYVILDGVGISKISSESNFKNGDLALRGNFSTLNDDEVIIDRRAGRHIEKEDADEVAKEIRRSWRNCNSKVD